MTRRSGSSTADSADGQEAAADRRTQPSGPATDERIEPSTPWRDNLEALAMAIVMALLLKYFILEAYKIPSGSMQPTLVGDERSQTFDRILVDKLSFKFRDPKRFEVVVFKYPLDLSKSFVKRVVGIGPEHIRISQGDLWTRPDETAPWKILRRPRSVQRETWKHLDRSDPDTPTWFADSSGLPWNIEGRRVEALGPGRAHFGADKGYVMDDYLDGYPDGLYDVVGRKRGVNVHPVGDVRVDCRVEVTEATEAIGFELYEGPRVFTFRFPGPAAPEGARPTIEESLSSRFGDVEARGNAEALAPFRLEAGRSYSIGAQNLDDLVELALDGEVLCAMEVANANDQRAICFVSVEGGGDAGAVFDDLMVYRDIYYTGGDLNEYHVPDGHYFMLGDNTQDSSDGREWKFARLRVQDELGDERVVIGNSRRDDDIWQRNPATVGIGDPEGAKVRFFDLYGEPYWLDGPGIPWASPPSEAASFVPRRLIQGRALAVFWPLVPRLGVYRWKWIH